MTTKKFAWNVKIQFGINRWCTVQLVYEFHKRITYEEEYLFTEYTMVDVVNVVSSGSLGIEVNLEAVTQEFSELVDYDPAKYPGAYFRFGESEPLITLYRTGKYIITGSSSEPEAMKIRERFLSSLHKHGVLPEADDDWFSVQNYVCVGDLAESLNLNALAIGLGLECTEYEPEQFPGLIYRPSGADSVVLLFASGRVVITGSPDLNAAEQTFATLQDEVTDFLTVD